jgi:hypothetical protein
MKLARLSLSLRNIGSSHTIDGRAGLRYDREQMSDVRIYGVEAVRLDPSKFPTIAPPMRAGLFGEGNSMEDVVMSHAKFGRHNAAMNSDDLRKCKLVLDAVCKEFRIDRTSDEARRIGAITIELYQQGVRSVEQLKYIVDAARGLDLRDRAGSNEPPTQSPQ